MSDLDSLVTLDDQQKSTIRRAGLVHPSEILLSSISDLGKKLKLLDSSDVTAIVQGVSRGVVPKSKTVTEMVEVESDSYLSSGDRSVDALLGGGLRRGAITEIAGESASGKSHMALQLALTTQLPSFTPSPGSAILLTSERKVSFNRLAELAPHMLEASRDAPSTSMTTLPRSHKVMLDNVHTMHVTEVDALDHALSYIVPTTISRIASQRAAQPTLLPVRLLIIDSIGALFRATYDSNHYGLTQRSKMLCSITDKLKELAEAHDLAVVVVNQVTDVFTQDRSSRFGGAMLHPPSSGSLAGAVPVIQDEAGEPVMTYKNQSRSFSGQTRDLAKEASLGLVWANGINTRLMLSRTGRRRALDHDDLDSKRKRLTVLERAEAKPEEEARWQSTLIRRMHLVFSPFAPEAKLDYVIVDSGIRSIGEVQLPGLPDDFAINGKVGVTSQDEDHFVGDLLDDLGELPAEFWSGEAFKQERVAAVERNALNQREQEVEEEGHLEIEAADLEVRTSQAADQHVPAEGDGIDGMA